MALHTAAYRPLSAIDEFQHYDSLLGLGLLEAGRPAGAAWLAAGLIVLWKLAEDLGATPAARFAARASLLAPWAVALGSTGVVVYYLVAGLR